MRKKIKLFNPDFSKNEELALIDTMKSGFWASGSGSGQVKRFEDLLSKYLRVKGCVAVNSGTSALHLALSLIDVKGKEVILPSLSFVSTAHAIIYNGGKPVFADIDPETLCINPELIEELITKKTKAALPVHFAGQACEMYPIIKNCKKYNLDLIEDAAHAIGTTYKNKKIGTHGTAVCFSFHPAKNLAMPTGGAITINNNKWKKYAEDLRVRRWCGISDRKDTTYDVKELGWNYYMNEFSATIGIEQLKKIDKLTKKRRENAKRFNDELKCEHKMNYDKECSYHFYWIRVKNRKKFIVNMKESGIEVGVHYKPIHTMSMYKKLKVKLPHTEIVGKEIVSIPTHSNLKTDDVDKVISTINKFCN
jgi:dTDP-4-amino-4,6-dideoxygalactose transaminase